MQLNCNGTAFILWGSSGHARVLNELIELRGGKVVAICDNSEHAVAIVERIPLLVGEAQFKEWIGSYAQRNSLRGLAAIGGSRGLDRLEIHRLFKSVGVIPQTVIHPSATVSRSVVIGEGCQILAHAVVAANVQLGEACILNHGAQADHECVLSDGVHMAPRSVLCGCVEVGKAAMIGAGAVVLPRLRIGKNAIVGAGAVVTKNVAEGVVVIGNPARKIRES